jgi:adenylate cyclase
MALEIERRFLVAGDGWRPHVRWRTRLRQGYLVNGPAGLTLRVRLGEATVRSEWPGAVPPGDSAWLTLKAPPPETIGSGAALTRFEFEYPIPCADAEAMLTLTPHQLSKRRYGLDLPGGEWVLDAFEGANAPLVVAEVELNRADQPVTVPPWCVRELTGLHELSNAALALRPLQAWSREDRESLLGPPPTAPAGEKATG